MVLSRTVISLPRPVLAVLPALVIPAFSMAESELSAAQLKQVVRVESVTIPMPGEFFAAINKQSRPNWKQFVRTGVPQTAVSRTQIALTLGTLVADGYIAVEAQDSQAVKNIGKEIINLAKKLNVSQSVLGRGNSINDFAENNDWNALREELEATQNEVKLDMQEQKDDRLVTLVTLGAWLRGTEIISGLIETSYTPESARLLRQPAIIDYLLDQVARLPEAMKTDPLIVSLRASLGKARECVKPQALAPEGVKELHQLMASMVREIGENTQRQ